MELGLELVPLTFMGEPRPLAPPCSGPRPDTLNGSVDGDGDGSAANSIGGGAPGGGGARSPPAAEPSGGAPPAAAIFTAFSRLVRVWGWG